MTVPLHSQDTCNTLSTLLAPPRQADTTQHCCGRVALGMGDHVHPSLADHVSSQPCLEGHGRLIFKPVSINYHAIKHYILSGGRRPKLGTIKDLFPSVYDAFQLPDLLLDSLFNSNVGYKDKHTPAAAQSLVFASFQPRRSSPLQQAPHWC